MGMHIKSFPDGVSLEYDKGSFDPWCVYIWRNGTRRAPTDEDYFRDLERLAKKYGAERVYNDCVRIYSRTGKRTERLILDGITQLAASYGDDALEVDITFSAIYMAMISEENKKNAPLGKRVKRLGIHKLLMENRSVEESANFMHGRPWLELKKLCEERGF